MNVWNTICLEWFMKLDFARKQGWFHHAILFIQMVHLIFVTWIFEHKLGLTNRKKQYSLGKQCHHNEKIIMFILTTKVSKAVYSDLVVHYIIFFFSLLHLHLPFDGKRNKYFYNPVVWIQKYTIGYRTRLTSIFCGLDISWYCKAG